MEFNYDLGIEAAIPFKKISSRDNTATIFTISLDYVDEEKNIAKHWSVEIYGNCVLRRWGRLPSKGDPGWTRSKETKFPTREKALAEGLSMARKKRRKGYKTKLQQEVVL